MILFTKKRYFNFRPPRNFVVEKDRNLVFRCIRGNNVTRYILYFILQIKNYYLFNNFIYSGQNIRKIK